MKSNRPTIGDVARVAGVAPMTVSRVLTGSAKVKAATSDKVRKAISLLRYEPNELARELRSRPTNGLGLAMPRLADSAAIRYADAIERLAAAQGLPLTLFSFHELARQQGSVVSRAAQRGLQRLMIISETESTSTLSLRDIESIHIVVLGGALPGVPVDTVTAQDRQGSRLAVKHLIGHKLTDIVFLHKQEETVAIREKLEGYRDAMSFASLNCDELAMSEPTGLSAALLEIGKRSDGEFGVLTASFNATLMLMRSLRHVKPALRKRVRFISLEDSPTAEFMAPSLTAIRQPVDEMSSLAMDLLMNGGVSGDAVGKGTLIRVPVELIIRGSCGCPEA